MAQHTFLKKHLSRKTLYSSIVSSTASSMFLKNKVSPYDRSIGLALTSVLFRPELGIGIFLGGALQLSEAITAKLVHNSYYSPVYIIKEHGELMLLPPVSIWVKGMDGIAIPGQKQVYKTVDGCYYKIDHKGNITLTGGVIQHMPHTIRGGGYKSLSWCIEQKHRGNPAWLNLYHTANNENDK